MEKDATYDIIFSKIMYSRYVQNVLARPTAMNAMNSLLTYFIDNHLRSFVDFIKYPPKILSDYTEQSYDNTHQK